MEKIRKLWLYKLFRRIIILAYNRLSVIAFYLSGENKRNSKKIEKLRNVFCGKRCFVVCNGPSLRADDLTKIYENGDISIGMNAIARIYDKTPWRPTLLSLRDDIAFTKKNKEMCRICESGYKFYDRSRYLRTLHVKGKKFYLKFNESKKLLDTPIFYPEATKKMPSIGTSAYIVLELAVFLGCREIYILGCDMSYAVNITKDGKIYCNNTGKEHFYGIKDEDLKTSIAAPNPTWQLEIAFDAAAKYAFENEIRIYNATRGGMLESFPRVDFDSLF